MTIFTVIKYGEINLGKKEDLDQLPDALIELYWEKANKADRDPDLGKPLGADRKRRALRLWYGDDTMPYEKEVARKIFHSALEEYDDL